MENKGPLGAPKQPSTGLVWMGICLALLLTPQVAATQTYSVVYTFQGGADGDGPHAGLVVDASGNLYGTTVLGGAGDSGTVFKVDAATGTETVLYSFTGGFDGAFPNAALVLDSAGNLYGTTVLGGFGNGVLFKVDPAGNETTLFGFSGGADGNQPAAGLLRDAAGNLYGTTAGGGDDNLGVIFKLNAAGTERILHSFAGPPTDGQEPLAPLIHDSAGNLYGTTQSGGQSGGGTAFKLSSTNSLTVLHSFTGGKDDGDEPVAGLVRDSAGNLYGTTSSGDLHLGGVVFMLTSFGTETILHKFTGGADGAAPAAPLVQARPGEFYGTTTAGGNLSCNNGLGCGVVFGVTSGGKESVLHAFNGADGATPLGALLPYKSALYGTTQSGGNTSGSCSPNGCGVVFKITLH